MTSRFLEIVCTPDVAICMYFTYESITLITHNVLPATTNTPPSNVFYSFARDLTTLVSLSPSGPLAKFFVYSGVNSSPFKVDFGLNRKILPVLYPGGCDIFIREFQINNDVCAGTLSWWGIQRLAFYDSGLFFFIDSRKRLETSK